MTTNSRPAPFKQFSVKFAISQSGLELRDRRLANIFVGYFITNLFSASRLRKLRHTEKTREESALFPIVDLLGFGPHSGA